MKRELNFVPHPNGLGGVQCKIKTDNGYTISIVGGGIGLYGDGKTTFEVAVWEGDNGDWVRLSPYDDVKGYVDKDDMDFILNQLSKL